MANIQRAVLLATLLAPLPAQARDHLGAARTFTQGLYEAYRHGEPDYLGARARTTFAPRLLALIRDDRVATAPGDEGAIDWDPICDCQDEGGMKVERVAIGEVAPDRALATVTLRFPAETMTVKLDLVTWRGQWRVADIHTRDAPSLVALLEKARAERR
jgi:hypothetical protein